MRKLALMMGSLLLSLNVIAASQPHYLSLAILNATQNHSNPLIKNSFPLIYGGQDISRPRIATANESLWSGQQTYIG